MGDTEHVWRGHVRLLEIQLHEHRDSVAADAALTTGSGTRVHGHGRARRRPTDPAGPDVGRLVAAAGALHDIAARLVRLASQAGRAPASHRPDVAPTVDDTCRDRRHHRDREQQGGPLPVQPVRQRPLRVGPVER